ncbi:hypothetical protein KPC_2457 [Acinetobacter stercoris]|uniref:Uncharacterized protein n=1 Tax=Acinetobacter stercoris TaxID=2126983 RepID=A0A2U3N149_9GAMM|nr:hypothetical protein KPC_2457 [Acinetobacter stercoris]
MLPDTIPLTDEQFKTFLEKAVANDHDRHMLASITEQNATTATPEGGAGCERDEEAAQGHIYISHSVGKWYRVAVCTYRCKLKSRGINPPLPPCITYTLKFHAGFMIPASNNVSKVFTAPPCSTIFPSTNLSISTPVMRNFLPVGFMPNHSPR